MTTFGIARRAAFAFAAVGVFGVVGLAQPPRDPIEAARAAQRVADQKAEADVTAALRAADALARTNPVKAAQSLKTAQNNIDLAAGLSAAASRKLTAQIQARIARLEGRPVLDPVAKADPATAVVKGKRQAVWDANVAETKAVSEGLELVKRYQDANRTAEANRLIADLAAKYPDNPAVITLTRKDSLATSVAEAEAFSKMQKERVLAAQNAPLLASLPPKGDIEFPTNWKDRDHRKNTVQLTAKEKQLMEALDKPVTLLFNGKSLEESLQELSNEMNQPVLIDKKSLDDLQVDLKKAVNLEAKGLSARTVMRQLLGAQGLTFVVKDETIQVVTVEKARDMLVTRVYYLGDVVQGVGPFAGALTWGPLLDFEQTTANVKLITDSIQDSIDPMSWKKRGGPCTVTFHFPSMSLIVRASSEVHATLGSKLGGGR